MKDSIAHWIHGQKILGQDMPGQVVFNPATGVGIAQVPFADSALCEQAIASARDAFPAWAATAPNKRAAVLFAFRHLLKAHARELAALVTREHGKTLDDAMGSVTRAVEVVEYHCALAQQFTTSFSSNVASEIDCQTLRQPLGVCAGVSPFNFPVMVPVWMMIPAIACGNTFILKPSEQAPSAPLRLMELLQEAGLPPGVVNCVHGNKETVDYLLHHPDIQAVTAVASTPVAQSIYTQATAQGKRAHTFGGAKNHALVMPDADMDYTAKAITGAAYGSAGERCMALSVVVCVGDATADRLLEKMTPLILAMKIDAGDVADTDMGPLISQAHCERVRAAIEAGIREGAQLRIDGRDFVHPQYPQGFYLGPCLFDRVEPEMSIYQNEIFGPVLVVLRVASFAEGLELINGHQYGNGSAIFTKDGYAAREYSQKVQAGMVGINIPIPVPVASHPFGGWKRSAFGDTNMHGGESLHFYTRRKTITSRWPVHVGQGSAFSMPTHD
ncbi:MAG: CoA-acylating methylmalonate-semialdehyde dehydrogenase [Legionellaceae bacterium]|nr:CoA-acylating methylmalonate-semialdehyde dehydrogenase [Legionellaceae bacterium]